MAKYSIRFKRSVAKDLRNIPNADVKRILSRINDLTVNPRGIGCVKLSSLERYRVKQGLYRIIYEIKDEELVVHVIKVGHRSSIYS